MSALVIELFIGVVEEAHMVPEVLVNLRPANVVVALDAGTSHHAKVNQLALDLIVEFVAHLFTLYLAAVLVDQAQGPVEMWPLI